jgi:hypothetical protein
LVNAADAKQASPSGGRDDERVVDPRAPGRSDEQRLADPTHPVGRAAIGRVVPGQLCRPPGGALFLGGIAYGYYGRDLPTAAALVASDLALIAAAIVWSRVTYCRSVWCLRRSVARSNAIILGVVSVRVAATCPSCNTDFEFESREVLAQYISSPTLDRVGRPRFKCNYLPTCPACRHQFTVPIPSDQDRPKNSPPT